MKYVSEGFGTIRTAQIITPKQSAPVITNLKKGIHGFGALPTTDEDSAPTVVVQSNNTTTPLDVQTMYTTTAIVESNPQTPISPEAVQVGMYSEDSEGVPSLNHDTPIASDLPSSGPVTQHFETSVATVGNVKEPMSKKKKLAVGGGIAAAAYFLLRN